MQTSSHVGFPEDFKRAVRALLLCHRRLEARGGIDSHLPEDGVSAGAATPPLRRPHGVRLSTRLLHRVCLVHPRI